MRFLAFSDTHGSPKAFARLKKKAKRVDFLVCAGDISIFENDIDGIVQELDSLGKPLYIIHGNHEEEPVMRYLAKEAKNIIFVHKKVVQGDGFQVVGYGGGGFSRTDPDFKEWASSLKKRLRKTKPAIMITHQPPHGTICDTIDEEKTGCRSFNPVLKKGLFRFWVCGHIHENAGKREDIKGTTLINPGQYGRILKV